MPDRQFLPAEATQEAPLVRNALAESLALWTDTLEGVLKEGQEMGDIRPSIDARKTARFLINSWEGAVIRMKIAATREPLDDFFDIAIALLDQQWGADADALELSERAAIDGNPALTSSMLISASKRKLERLLP